jgi:hypothetical protein
MSDIRIDDDGFLVGDGEQERTEAENVLMREIKADTTTIISLMKGTQRLQRDALKAAQSADKTKGNQSNNSNNGNVLPRVNLQHPNRANGANNQGQRVNLQHPNRPPISSGNGANGGQQRDTAQPRIQQNRGGNAGAPTPQSGENGRNGTARVNRQRDANGRFIGGDNADIGSESESAQRRGNRDSRGRFVGGDGSAAERSTVSRITDSLKDLNSNLTLNADTDRIDPMVDAIKEASSIVAVGIDASKKVLSVSNTLIAKPAMALGRGIKGLFKPKTDAINSPVAWYKRIWRTLERGNRQDQTQHAQEQRRLDELVRGQGQRGSADSGLLLMLGLGLSALLAALKKGGDLFNNLIPDFLKKQDNQSPVPVVGAPKVRPPVSALPPTRTQAMLQRLSASPVGNAARWLSETSVGKAIGGFVKRLPLITSAIEAGAGAINAVNIDNDQTLTDEQKQRKQAQNAGATAGAIGGGLGGAAAGAMVGSVVPVVGTIIGGIVGAWLGTTGGRIVGDKIGGWVDDLANADIAGRMGNAWDAFLTPLTPMFAEIKNWTVSTWQKTQDVALGMWKSVTIDAKATWSTITSSWDGLITNVSSGFESIATTATEFNDWFKKKTGIDIGKGLTGAKDAVVDTVSRNVVPVVVGMGESLAINAKANTEKLKEKADNFYKDWQNTGVVQGVSKLIEGGAGAWTALTTPTDNEKTAKTKTKKATSKQELNKKGYSAYNDVLEAAYSKNGFNDPQSRAFLKGQIQAESNFKPNAKSPAGAFGISQFMPDTAKQYKVMSGDSPEAVKSQAEGQTKYMQYLLKRYKGDWEKALAGYNTGEGNLDKKLKTAKEKGVDWKTLLPQETKDYLVRVKQNAMNFGAVSASQVATVTPKAITTPKANTPTNTVPTLKTAPVNAASSPSVQSVPSVQAQESPRRLDNTPTPIKVSMPKPLVGQNISDRGIAHILTGGIGETV